MFAVIKTGGKQYRVQEGDILEVEKLDRGEKQEIVFNEVLLVENGKETLIGTPYVESVWVKAMALDEFKDAKVIVFKKKRRKQYKRTKGHRQELTRVKIEGIVVGKEPAPKPKPKVEERKPEKIEAAEAKKPRPEKPKAPQPKPGEAKAKPKTKLGKKKAKRAQATPARQKAKKSAQAKER